MTLLGRFLDDHRGNIAIIFALAAIPVIGATGAAVDFSNAFRQRSIVQDAIDAAALAANKKLASSTQAQAEAEAIAFYNANIAGQIATPPPLKLVSGTGKVTVSTTLHVPTTILGIMGMKEIVFDLEATASEGGARLEVAMVLDTSTSMSGSKISTLQTAATNLTNTLFTLAASSSKIDPVKIALIPFSGAVNVGRQYKSASWMDLAGNGTYHKENYAAIDPPKTRFDLFSDMGVTWGGCVEERPIPYDAADDPPSGAFVPSVEQKKTLFVPMFAPDEPDPWSGSHNDYLSDRGNIGGCGKPLPAATINTPQSLKDGQERACKYKGATPANITPMFGFPGGPNFTCTATPVTKLTTDKASVLAAISALRAFGTTNITAGIAWGWRALSPTPPFTDGRDYADKDNKKVLILMTDGENTYFPDSSVFNSSAYGAWGYVANGHLGTTSTSTAVVEAAMDNRSKATCYNIRATGKFTVYTIAFQVTTQRGKDLMAYCASDPSKAFDAADNTALLNAFAAIGADLTQLRLVK